MPPEYRHYFCDPCGAKHKQIVAANAASLPSTVTYDWQTVIGEYECGDWSKDKMKFQGHGCGKPAKVLLVSRGGTPIQYGKGGG